MDRILFIPDCHIPFEDKRAYALMLKAAKVFKPTIIVILGDYVDFYSVSAHDKNPMRRISLDFEVAEAVDRLAELAKAHPKATKYYLAGNHENRLERYIASKASQLFEFTKIEQVLELKELGYKYRPYKDFVKLGNLYLTHDTGRTGRYCAQQSLSDTQHNIIVGHSHRLSYCVEGNAAGTPHVGACFGWLGDKNDADYMHRIRANRDWALGFGIGYLLKNGNVHVRPIPIVDYTVVIEGKLVVG